MPFPFLRLMLLMPLLAGFGAQAASIGEIDVSSHLGEPLVARVPIDIDGGSLSGDDCVRIVGSARRHPDLANARVALTSREGRNYISIVTDKAINDPVLDLTLRTYCGPSLQKDFVILLTPGRLAPASTKTPTAVAMDKQAGPDMAPPPSADKPAQDRQVQDRTAQRPAGSGKKPMPANLPGDSTSPRQAVETTPPNTVSTAAASGSATLNDTAPDLQAPMPEVIPPWYARLLGPYLWLLLLPVLLAVAGALWLNKRRPRVRFQDETTPVLNTLFPLDSEIQPARPHLASDLPAREPPPLKPEPVKPPPLKPKPVEPAKTEPLPEKTAPPPPSGLSTEAMERMMGNRGQPSQSEDFPVEPAEPRDSFDHVMELAEVMLAFGRSGQAIEALSRHIHSHPRQAIDPWLKLLDLYQQSDLRPEFEALASDLHSHYNIALPNWDDCIASPDMAHETGPLTLESLPHIMSRLTETWGSPAALDYLNKLLDDNRGGQRLGFSMSLVRDILLLRDILRQSGPGSAGPH